jgi:hypothetical protein
VAAVQASSSSVVCRTLVSAVIARAAMCSGTNRKSAEGGASRRSMRPRSPRLASDPANVQAPRSHFAGAALPCLTNGVSRGVTTTDYDRGVTVIPAVRTVLIIPTRHRTAAEWCLQSWDGYGRV